MVDDEKETETFVFDCWDPDSKWDIQDVSNHMGETLEQMFRVFEIESEDQQYQLDVLESVNENFPMKIEIKKSKHVESVMENFRRQGHLKGGGCVKFFRKYISLISFPFSVVIPEVFRSTIKTGVIQIPVPKPINLEFEIPYHKYGKGNRSFIKSLEQENNFAILKKHVYSLC